MLFDEIVQLAKEHGWKQQGCGIAGISGCVGTNFYKDGKVLTVSITEEGDMIYPDDDELKEMFEGLQKDKINPVSRDDDNHCGHLNAPCRFEKHGA